MQQSERTPTIPAKDQSDLALELLRQIRAELETFRSDFECRFDLVDHRFEKLETDMLEVKRTLSGMTYSMTTSTGRLEDSETRVDRTAPRWQDRLPFPT